MVATKPVDFRKGAEGLAALVREEMKSDPFSGAVYVFRAKRADRAKLIYWDGTGVCLFAKPLEDGKFRWPSVQDSVMRLSAGELEGLDWRRVHAARETPATLPLYRQAQIYARQGVNLDRSTLADWVGRAAFLLRPVHERLLAILKASTNSLQTRPRRRYSIQAADEPRPGSSSPMRATIVPGAGPIRPASPMSMLRTARPRVRSLISPASSACCRSTATAAIAYWPKETS
jgi:transposase